MQEGDEIDGVPIESISVSANGYGDEEEEEVWRSLGFILGITIPIAVILLIIIIVVCLKHSRRTQEDAKDIYGPHSGATEDRLEQPHHI